VSVCVLSRDENPLSLAELIDLELQLAADEEVDRKTLFERDGALGDQILAEHTEQVTPSRHDVFRAWLEAVAPSKTAKVGERVVAVYRLAGWGLAAFGLLSGAGAAAGLLHYDGTQPVNVVHFLTVLVLVQILLLSLPLLHMLPRAWLRWAPGFGPLHELLRAFGYRQAGLERLLAKLPGDHGRIPLALAHLRSWSTVYADVERWSLLVLTQRVGVFFNLGALATCVYLVAVTDLAFAWSTTLSFDPHTMTQLLRLMALPWWWLPAAVPSQQLVEASRYFRQAAGSYDPVMLKDWWAFLVAALFTYGLLPRLLLWRISTWNAYRARARLPLDHGECEAVYERLMHGTRGWVGAGAAEEAGEVPAAERREQEGDEPEAAPIPAATEVEGCLVVCWADVPLRAADAGALIGRRFGWPVSAVHAIGGKDALGQHELVQSLARSRSSQDPVVVVAEAWEAPGKAVRRLLRDLRAAVGGKRPILLCLVAGDRGAWTAPGDEDRRIWRRVVRAMGDPYLRVEDLVVA